MTTVPSIRAGAARRHRRSSPPCATTGRSATGPTSSTTRRSRDLCPACTATMMTKCVQPRAGAASVAAWPLIPYMRANLRDEASHARARVGASSPSATRIARRPARARARAGADAALHDSQSRRHDGARSTCTTRAPRPLPSRTCSTPASSRRTRACSSCCRAVKRRRTSTWPLVVVGDGPLRARSRSATRARAASRLRVLGWLDRARDARRGCGTRRCSRFRRTDPSRSAAC